MQTFSSRQIGILGGGQLGRMLWQAGVPLLASISFLDPDPDCPAAKAGARVVVGDFRDYETVMQFGAFLDVIGIEIEQVNVSALKALEAMGKRCIPSASVIECIQDKALQKEMFRRLQIPSSSFEVLMRGGERSSFSFPYFLKVCKGGYDGYGVKRINSEEDLRDAFSAPCIAEEAVSYVSEFAIVLGRDSSGSISMFPAVKMDFDVQTNMIRWLQYPSELPKESELLAETYSIQLAEALELEGLLALEFFLLSDGRVLLNEVAPRPHNSGHWTIDACQLSQFSAYVYVLSGYPLPAVNAHSSAVMVNVNAGDSSRGIPNYGGFISLLKHSEARLHLYGKTETRPNRKMGHMTFVGSDLGELKRLAIEAFEMRV
jgi:5-(carboxyamino)imidazole ribonucleotide synthase